MEVVASGVIWDARTAPVNERSASANSAIRLSDGTVLVKTGRKKRCVKPRAAPPPPRQADRGQTARDLRRARSTTSSSRR